jgi:integrase
MNFNEMLEKDYSEMLNLSESIGYSRIEYNSHSYIKEFILLCGNTYTDANCITKEMIDLWLQQKHFKTNTTHNCAISQIRKFTKYQVAIGKDTFVPGEEYSVKGVNYTPYIFTDAELQKLFEAFDTLHPHFESPEREFIVPVLFRMMYCCGMRPSEPLKLLFEDVNLQTGEIYIRQSKRKKDRRILMSKDLISLCCRYDSFKKPRTYFFEKSDGSSFATYWMRNQFRICWRNSGLVKHGNPRPYDFRHNYATRTMMRWINEGKDVMAMVSYLSAYMGHTKFTSTLYYIHLLPERLMKSSGIDWKNFSCIYPEVVL